MSPRSFRDANMCPAAAPSGKGPSTSSPTANAPTGSARASSSRWAIIDERRELALAGRQSGQQLVGAALRDAGLLLGPVGFCARILVLRRPCRGVPRQTPQPPRLFF